MKNTVTALLLIFSITAFGQSYDKHMNNGISKLEKRNYKGAIKAFTKAIKVDNSVAFPYYSRGVCSIEIEDFETAKKDFDKTIELEPKNIDAYYCRASVFARQKKDKEALVDLNKAIEIEPNYIRALMLRGAIRLKSNTKLACEDLNRAKELGDQSAEEYLIQFCNDEPTQKESFVLDWPAEEWTIGSQKETQQIFMKEYILVHESLESWTEYGSMVVSQNLKSFKLDFVMNALYEETIESAPEAKLTLIEEDESAEYPWIIFTIESPKRKNDKTPESQLWYIVKGKAAVYSNSYAIKKETFPSDLQAEWIEFFKKGKIVVE